MAHWTYTIETPIDDPEGTGAKVQVEMDMVVKDFADAQLEQALAKALYQGLDSRPGFNVLHITKESTVVQSFDVSAM